MADRMAAEIWIGGSIPESLVEELCGHIRDEGVSVDYGEASFEPHTARDLLEAATTDSDLLRLCDDEVANGEFPDLEDWLLENSIPYTRKSDGKYEHNPVIVEFRPEEGLHECIANKALEPVVPVEDVREAADLLKTAADLLRENSFVQGAVQVSRAFDKLQEALPRELSPLPPLTISPEPTRQVEYYRLWAGNGADCGNWDTERVYVPLSVLQEGKADCWIRAWAMDQQWDDDLVSAGLYHIPEPEEELGP